MRSMGILANTRRHVLLWGQSRSRRLQGRRGGPPVQARGWPGIGAQVPALRARGRTGEPAERLPGRDPAAREPGSRLRTLPFRPAGGELGAELRWSPRGAQVGESGGIESKNTSGGLIHGAGTPGVQWVVRRAVSPMPKDGRSGKGPRTAGCGCGRDRCHQLGDKSPLPVKPLHSCSSDD